DLAHQFRPAASAPAAANGTELPRPANAVRFRSGSTSPRRATAAVPMVGVVTLGAVGGPAASEKPAEADAVVAPVAEESKPAAVKGRTGGAARKKAASRTKRAAPASKTEKVAAAKPEVSKKPAVEK